MIILGVDPGASGAAAILRCESGALTVEALLDWPPLDDPRAGARLLEDALLDCGAGLRISGKSIEESWGFVEQLGTLPHPFGKRAAVQLGRAYEAARCAVSAVVLSYRELSPKIWQAEIWRGERRPSASTDKKRQSLAKARALFPGAAAQLARAKDHGRAEALLIAEAGRRLMIGGKA